jgi:hypothetical protein
MVIRTERQALGMDACKNLVAAHPGNLNALRHGIYSSRVLAPRAREIADQLMGLPHVRPLDALAADEIGSIVARVEAIDRDLDERGQVGRGGARSLLEHRVRLSRELRAWLKEFGGTPKSRADFANRLASSESMAEAILGYGIPGERSSARVAAGDRVRAA